jgi:hypothetical protein
MLLLLQLALHHDLGGNAGVVGAGNPHGVEARHAVVARQAVHDGLVERVAHVQRAGHVGRRQLDGERGLTGLWCLRAAETGHAITALLPLGAPTGFQRRGLERFGEGLQAGLFRGFVGRVGHGGGVFGGTGDFTGLQPCARLVPRFTGRRPAGRQNQLTCEKMQYGTKLQETRL